MSKIFNELEYAENLLEHGFSNFMNVRDLCILAKYYKYLGKNEKKIYNLLEEFCIKYEPSYNSVIYNHKLNTAINSSKNYNIRIPVDVPITKNELDKIKFIKNYRYEKILFVMLVIGKYYKLTNTKIKREENKEHENDLYYNGRLTEVFRYAHIGYNKIERIGVSNDLYLLGMIESKGQGNYLLHYNDTDINSEISIIVNDMKNIISFYPFYCSVCGKQIEKNNNRHKMCDNCYKEKEKERLKKYSYSLTQ